MNQGPLTAQELEWLEDVLVNYNSDDSILDVSELDGMLTAVLSGPNSIQPEYWLSAIWGGVAKTPKWRSGQEQRRFMDLTFQHMSDIAERLSNYQEQFEPLFGTRDVEEHEFTIVEEWCFGYMRGVALDDWSGLPQALQPSFDAIALHGLEENFPKIDGMQHEDFTASIEKLRPAALELHAYWLSQRHL